MKGSGPSSQSRLKENPGLTRDLLYLQHMSKVIEFVKQKYPDKRIFFWDDMIRNVPEQTLQMSGASLAQFAEPVVWNYSSEPEKLLTDSVWEKYQNVFPSFWIATAFKGNQTPSSLIKSAQNSSAIVGKTLFEL